MFILFKSGRLHRFYCIIIIIAAIKELFEQFDKDNNGTLSAKELEESLFLCQRNPTPKELKKLTKELGIKNGKFLPST